MLLAKSEREHLLQTSCKRDAYALMETQLYADNIESEAGTWLVGVTRDPGVL